MFPVLVSVIFYTVYSYVMRYCLPVRAGRSPPAATGRERRRARARAAPRRSARQRRRTWLPRTSRSTTAPTSSKWLQQARDRCRTPCGFHHVTLWIPSAASARTAPMFCARPTATMIWPGRRPSRRRAAGPRRGRSGGCASRRRQARRHRFFEQAARLPSASRFEGATASSSGRRARRGCGRPRRRGCLIAVAREYRADAVHDPLVVRGGAVRIVEASW